MHFLQPGRFPGNAGNPGNYGKFHKSHQILNKTKRNINKLRLGKISRQNTVRTKFSMDSGFSNMLCGKKQKLRHAGNQRESFLNQKALGVNYLPLLQNS